VVLLLDDPETKSATAKPVVDADHGRIETHTASVSTEIDWLQKQHQWPGLKAVGKVVWMRETAEKTTTETAYYLLSSEFTPERFNEVAHQHWGVENSLLWRLDVVMNEDLDRTRMGHGPENLAVLRPMAINAIEKEGSKGSLRGKFKSAGRNENYISRLLTPFLKSDSPGEST
jgi:predicted transposase YbfD/YdcC